MPVYHLIVWIYYLFTIWSEQSINIPMMRHEKDMKFLKGELKYLTIWNLLLQTLFATICVLNDLIGNNENIPKSSSKIRKFKDLLLATVALPLSMFVGLTFWGIYLVNFELLIPEGVDQQFPPWLNHALHTNSIVLVLIELYTSYHQYPKRKLGLKITIGFMLSYLILIHYLHYHTGVWPYPILEVLNLPLRLVFFIVSLLICIGFYILGEKFNNLFWSRKIEVIKRKN